MDDDDDDDDDDVVVHRGHTVLGRSNAWIAVVRAFLLTLLHLAY
jgi:hypothetical protein